MPVPTISDLRRAEHLAERAWREALLRENQLDRAEKFLRFLQARHDASTHTAD